MEWLKQLRMDSLRRVAVRIVVPLVLAAGVFVYFRCWSLAGMVSPKPLSALEPESMEGVYVEDDIYWLYTPYLEERYGESWSTGTLTGVQYLISFDQEYYMGLSVHKDRLEEAGAMMEAVEAIMAGELSEEELPVLHVKGSIKAMDEEERGYYLELASGSAELEALMLPYYLDVNRIHGRTVLMEAAMLVLSLALLAAALFPLVKALTGGYQKQVLAKLREADDFASAAERAAQFYDRAEPISGVRMGADYVFFQNGADSVLLRPWELAWAYQSTTQHKTNGVPTGKTYAAVLRTMDGAQYTLPMKEEAVHRLLEAMPASLPGIVLGYTAEIERLYRENREAFAARWKDRIPGHRGVAVRP